VEKFNNFREKLKNLGVSAESFGTALEVVLSYLKNPIAIWENGELQTKKLILRLVFAEKLAFHHKDGFGTAQMPLIIGQFEQISVKDSQGVEMAGVEPACVRYLPTDLRRVDCFHLGVGDRNRRTHPIPDLYFLSACVRSAGTEPHCITPRCARQADAQATFAGQNLIKLVRTRMRSHSP
jgi:hypothetical protein